MSTDEFDDYWFRIHGVMTLELTGESHYVHNG